MPLPQIPLDDPSVLALAQGPPATRPRLHVPADMGRADRQRAGTKPAGRGIRRKLVVGVDAPSRRGIRRSLWARPWVGVEISVFSR